MEGRGRSQWSREGFCGGFGHKWLMQQQICIYVKRRILISISVKRQIQFQISIKDLKDLKWFQNYCTCTADLCQLSFELLGLCFGSSQGLPSLLINRNLCLILYGSIKDR